MREHAMAVAASMLPHMEPTERNFLGMVNVAEGLIRYYKLGPPPNGQPQQQQAPQPVPAQGGEWGDPGPEQGDPGPEWPA